MYIHVLVLRCMKREQSGKKKMYMNAQLRNGATVAPHLMLAIRVS